MSLPRAHALCFAVCALLLGGMLGSRVLRYAVAELPGGLERALGILLTYQALLFFGVYALVGVFRVPLIWLALVALVLLRKRLSKRSGDVISSAPLLYSLLWVVFVLFHVAFDFHPLVAGACFLTLPLLWRSGREFVLRPLGRLRTPVLLAAGAAMLAAVRAADDVTSMFAVGIWLAVLAFLIRTGERRLLRRDRLALALCAIPFMQWMAACGPVLIANHGWKRLVPRFAYGFCESPRHERLYAAMPACPTLPSWRGRSEECLRGVVAALSPPLFAVSKTYELFTETYFGRPEQVLCLDDAVEVGMNGMVRDGVETRDGAVEIAPGRPDLIRRDVAGVGMGHRIAYDAKRDALLYTTEWGHGMVRRDRKTGQLTRITEGFDERAPLLHRLPHSHELGPDSIHHGRDSLFVAEWIGGSVIYELGLDTLRVRSVLPHDDGASVGVTVDEQHDRLYVAGLWGMEVIDLRTGHTIARKRLGLLTRVPVIDAAHDRIFIPSTVAGRIYEFDRQTLERRATIPIGYGVRLLHISASTGLLLASSVSAIFAWPTAWLAGLR